LPWAWHNRQYDLVGYGAWWLLIAILKTARYFREGVPFNLSWWGFIFPLGVYSLATLALARATHLGVFSVAGSILVVCLAALWLTVAVLPVDGAWHGDLFRHVASARGCVSNRFESEAG
jgi:tellurite resistance protein TehA-like permease